jgi:hypothetical protein
MGTERGNAGGGRCIGAKPEAARAVEKDDLLELARNIEIAGYAVQELTEEYFDKHSPGEPRGELAILWGFRRARAWAEITRDCLALAKKEAEAHGISFWD